MAGFFKKLFNRIIGKPAEEVPLEVAPVALPAPEPEPEPEIVLEKPVLKKAPAKKPAMPDKPYGGLFITKELIEKDDVYPYMDGPAVFKKAIEKFPEVIIEALTANGFRTTDIGLLIPHQANLRIMDAAAKR